MRRCYMHIQLYKHATLHNSTGHAAASCSQPASRAAWPHNQACQQSSQMHETAMPAPSCTTTQARACVGMMLGLLLGACTRPSRGEHVANRCTQHSRDRPHLLGARSAIEHTQPPSDALASTNHTLKQADRHHYMQRARLTRDNQAASHITAWPRCMQQPLSPVAGTR